MWRTIRERVEGGARGDFRPVGQEPLSPKSKCARVQKPSKEARELLAIFIKLHQEIKQTVDLRSAAAVIADYCRHSATEDVCDSQVLERIENHAEGLLNDLTFMETFRHCHVIQEIQRFRGRNWWKRASLPPRRPWKPRVSEASLASSSATASMTDNTSIDLSQEEMETPPPGSQAKKGKSVLRPRFSKSMTPSTPTRETNRHGSVSSELVTESNDLTNGDEDELQLLEIPPGFLRMPDEKTARKRKMRVHVDDPSETSKRSRKQENTQVAGMQFGRGRPPLTTVKVFHRHVLAKLDFLKQ